MPHRSVLLAALLSSAPVSAVAQPREDPLPELARLVRRLEYEDALREARALRTDPGTPAATRLRAIELQAIAEIGLGDAAAARQSFETLVRLDPEYELFEERSSPRVRETFAAARAGGSAPRGGLVVGVAAPVLDGAPAAASARPVGEHAIATIRFIARIGAQELQVREVPGGPPWRADIVLPRGADPSALGVVARGYAPSGALSAVSPVSRIVAEDDGPDDDAVVRAAARPRRRARGGGPRPWVWAVVGAAVVVGTFAIVLIASSGGDDEGDPGAGG